MATNHTHRVLLAIPAGLKAATVTWWDANMSGAHGAETWSRGLSATGLSPAVAWWCSTALTDAELAILVAKVCQMSSVAFPGGWGGFTKQQKIDWVIANAAAIQAGANVRIVRADNDGVWNDPQALLTAAGLQRIPPVVV